MDSTLFLVVSSALNIHVCWNVKGEIDTFDQSDRAFIFNKEAWKQSSKLVWYKSLSVRAKIKAKLPVWSIIIT